ncbi:hypothetical protein Trydic_g10282, partial [Trypoxylus dichotomus]
MAKQTPGSKCDTGTKYELSVTALFASFLSKNENVENYRIFSNIGEAQPFDDIVSEVYFKEAEQSQIYAIQIKSGKDKFNVNKYCDGYEKIAGSEGLRLGENTRNNRIHFWYFCNKGLTKNTFSIVRNAETIDLKLRPRSRPYNIHEAVFDKIVSFELSPVDPNLIDLQNFFDNFYLFLNQPDTKKVIHAIKGMWNIDKPWLILLYLDNYFANNSNGLDKASFEHELLKIRLSDYVVTPTRAIAFQHDAVDEWNRLTLRQNVTIVQNEMNVEQYLFGCVLQSISDIISIEEWNRSVDNVGKLSLHIKSKLKPKPLKIETLRDLVVQAWVEGKTPLLLKIDTSFLLLKEFPHLKKSYILIDSDVDKRYNEIKNYELSVFRHLGDVQADEIMKRIPVSLQGRKPVSLYTIINGNRVLMESVTCLDIIHLMKPRTAYLKQECLDGNDYMLFIIEIGSCQQHNYDEYQPSGNNITIYCGIGQSCEYYRKIRADPRFRSYKIFRLLLTDDNKLLPIPKTQELETIQSDEVDHYLGYLFVDQNEENVYNSRNSSPIPVIGEIPTRNCSKCVPRHLRGKYWKNLPSKGKFSVNFMAEYNGERFAEKDFFKESNGKLAVITGEPGMGKSTLLRSLFHRCESKYYVLFVDLIHFQADLYERNPKLFQNPLQFLYDRHRVLPYSRLLRNLYDCHDRLVLLLDSFDEGVATTRDELLKLIRNFQEIGLPKIVTASRLTVVNLLIDKFEAETFKIEGFSEESHSHYIDNWHLNVSHLRHIPSELLTNPLYLNMLRTISENEINLKVVNRWNLYETIVNLKMKDYCQRIKPHFLDENEKQNILSYHWRLALQAVLGGYSLPEKLKETKQTKYSNFIRLGFITYFDSNENPIFIHHTFAEFFVLQWLIQNPDHANAPSVYMLILKSKGHMLDMLSEKFPFHKAVLYDSVENLEKLCTENSEYLLETDDLGRNALHLATLLCERDFFQKSNRLNSLLQYMRRKGYDLYVPDKIMKWTWIHYWEDYIFVRYLWKDEYVATLEAYLSYYATHIEELRRSKFSVGTHFNKLYNIAIRHSSISMIQDLLFLKYHGEETFLEFREMCLHSRAVNRRKLLNLKFPEENLRGVHLACVYSSLEIVRIYVKAGANFNKPDIFNCTPLHYSIFAKKNTEITKLLLKDCKISNPHAGQGNDTTILHMSVRSGDANVTKMLLERVDVNVVDKRRFTPLLAAIELANQSTRLQVVEVLLEHKAEVNFLTSTKYTPLELAIMYGNRKVVDMLLKYKADVNFSNSKHVRPLCKAINMKNIEIIELLLQNGAYVNQMCLDGLTPLIYAIKVKDKDIIRLLLNYNADVNCRNKYDKTPLCRAIEEKSVDIVEFLLQNGANANYVDIDGLTPLTTVVATRKRDAVPIPLDNNTYVNFPVENAIALTSNEIQIIKLLLQYGADVNYMNSNGVTPLTHAIKLKDKDVIRILLQHGADINVKDMRNQTPLCKAIDAKSTEIIELLLLNGAYVNCMDLLYRTPLVYAIATRKENVVQTLLDHEADINLQNDDGQTPLYNAIKMKRMTSIELLLKAEADPNCTDKFCFTPLITAVEMGHLEIVELLLKYNANVNFKNDCGITALYVAAFKRNVNMVELLLKYGADADVVTFGGEFLRNPNKTKNIVIVLRLLRGRATNEFPNTSSAALNIIRNVTESWHDVDLAIELRVAVQEGVLNFDTLQTLIRWGGNMNLADEFWIRILALVEEINSEDLDNILIRNVFNFDRVTDLCHAISETGNLDIIKILLRCGVKADSINRETGLTLLQTAVEMNYKEFVQILLLNHADVNLTNNNDTPLCIAVRKQNIDIIKMLLSHGDCDVNRADKYGLTPLIIAVADEHIPIAELLLTYYADVNLVGYGLTALYMAARTGNRCMVDMLFKHGAKGNIKTSGAVLLR